MCLGCTFTHWGKELPWLDFEIQKEYNLRRNLYGGKSDLISIDPSMPEEVKAVTGIGWLPLSDIVVRLEQSEKYYMLGRIILLERKLNEYTN